jgi:hypothetical protein
MLHGVDCQAAMATCDGTCQGYLSCTAACVDGPDVEQCLTGCAHAGYGQAPGGLIATAQAQQFLVCACCQ